MPLFIPRAKNVPASMEVRLVYLILFVLPFEHLAKLSGPLFGDSEVITAGKIFILLTLAVWAVRCLVQKDAGPLYSLVESRTTVLLLAYAWVLLLGLLPARTLSVGVVVILQRFSLIILYLLLINILVSTGDIRKAMLVLLISSFFPVMGGIYEMVSGHSILPAVYQRSGFIVTGEGTNRIQSFAGDPDLHAAFLIILSGILLFMIRQARSLKIKGGLAVLYLLYLVNVIATGSRAGWLGIGFSSLVFFLFTRMRRKWSVMTGFVLTFLLLFTVLQVTNLAPVMERLQESSSSGNKSIQWRLGWAMMSLAMFRDHPVFGIGTGNYYSEFNRYVGASKGMASALNIKPNHNGFLQTLAENGIIGFLVFTALVFVILADIFYIIRAGPLETREMGVGLLASYAGFIYCISVYPALGSEFGWIVIVFSTALSALLRRNPSRGKM